MQKNISTFKKIFLKFLISKPKHVSDPLGSAAKD
jgi:hypothetical protein